MEGTVGVLPDQRVLKSNEITRITSNVWKTCGSIKLSINDLVTNINPRTAIIVPRDGIHFQRDVNIFINRYMFVKF